MRKKGKFCVVKEDFVLKAKITAAWQLLKRNWNTLSHMYSYICTFTTLNFDQVLVLC